MFFYRIILFSFILAACAPSSSTNEGNTQAKGSEKTEQQKNPEEISDGFSVRYTEKNGTQWSQSIGPYSNGCTALAYRCSRSVEEDSQAQYKCKKIGGRLPSEEDYYRMLAEFDHEIVWDSNRHRDVLRLTVNGSDDFYKTFAQKDGVWRKEDFWTSTVYSGDTYKYEIAAAQAGSYNTVDLRSRKKYVRCIRKTPGH